MATTLIFVLALLSSQLGSSNCVKEESPKSEGEANMMTRREEGTKSKETEVEAKKEEDQNEKGMEDSSEEDVTYKGYGDDFKYPSYEYEEYQGEIT